MGPGPTYVTAYTSLRATPYRAATNGQLGYGGYGWHARRLIQKGPLVTRPVPTRQQALQVELEPD